MARPIPPGSLVHIVSVFEKPIKKCSPALVLDVDWEEIDILSEYYEGWTYTILLNGQIEEFVSHEWITEIQNLQL